MEAFQYPTRWAARTGRLFFMLILNCTYMSGAAAAAERGVVQIGEKRHFRERSCGLPDSLPISTLSDFFFLKHRRGVTIPGHFMSANRAASSKQPRFNRHRRRFGCYPPPSTAHLLFLWQDKEKEDGGLNRLHLRGCKICGEKEAKDQQCLI
ncbi:MAG: hypothetical protein IKL23_00720 [Oscillospiraceae bacterium]|nr:hypothetical protein [Oscillospiraceae bacterium]